MGFAFLMVRLRGLHAIRVVSAGDDVIFTTAWHEAPQGAVGEARAWLERNWLG
jgi:hypothetical protein